MLVGIFAQRSPLGEKDVLQEDTEVDLIPQFLGDLCERFGLAVAHRLFRPHVDRHMVVLFFLECHEQRVVGQPVGVFLGERVDLFAQLIVDAGIGFAEQRPTGIG